MRGKIQPKELVEMSPEDMASEELMKERERISQAHPREIQEEDLEKLRYFGGQWVPK
jgi:hypothetical protein